MAVPPQLIRVKRKATDETPVSFLRVQESKKRRSDFFVYQRQDPEAAITDAIPRHAQRPVIHTSSPKGGAAAASHSPAHPPTNTAVDPRSNHGETIAPGTSGATEPRRFHMSRPDAALTDQYPGRAGRGVSKKRANPALFVERKIKKISPKTVEKLHAVANASASRATSPAAHDPAEMSAAGMDLDSSEPKKYKKPGVAKLAGKGDTPRAKTEFPSTMTDGWNLDMEKLTDEMNAYAMEQIGLNLRRIEEEKQREKAAEQRRSASSSHMRFKPKPPAKRYAERHPEEASSDAATGDQDMKDVDDGASESDEDDGDYIIETYVRVPASKMAVDIRPENVGLLVFDRDPDMEYFYGGDEDSEDEWAEDEEDENAENYYTADYPEDEVASDDEFGQNPYSYRTGNASDLEEFDEFGDSDDDDDSGGDGDDVGPKGFKSFRGKDGTSINHL